MLKVEFPKATMKSKCPNCEGDLRIVRSMAIALCDQCGFSQKVEIEEEPVKPKRKKVNYLPLAVMIGVCGLSITAMLGTTLHRQAKETEKFAKQQVIKQETVRLEQERRVSKSDSDNSTTVLTPEIEDSVSATEITSPIKKVDALPNQGKTYDIIKAEAKAAHERLIQGRYTSLADADIDINILKKRTQQEFDAGVITGDEAIRRYRTITNARYLSADHRLEAHNLIMATMKEVGEREIDDIQRRNR